MKLIQWIKNHKLISTATLLSTIFVITFIILLTTSLINNEKDKQNRTYLDRDKTEIICPRHKKIGSAKVTYATKDKSDIWKTTLFLYCTDNPTDNDYIQLSRKIKSDFYDKYEKKINLKFADLNKWELDNYSIEWNKKYNLNDNNFDEYFIN